MQPRQREPLTDLFEAVDRFRSTVDRILLVIMIAAVWSGILLFVLRGLRAWIAHDLDNTAWFPVLLFQGITIGITVAFDLLIRPSSRFSVLRIIPSVVAFIVVVAFAYFAPTRAPRAGTVALYAEAIAGGAYVAFVARSWRRRRARAELPRATARPSGRTHLR